MDSSRGSIWRKWDLHVHTPFTQLSNGYGNDDAVWDEFIDVIEKSDVQAIGITDYNTAANYFEFLKRYEAKYSETTKAFFFNLELRLEVSVNKAAEEVNIHIIFDNQIPGFQTKINKFLTTLKTSITRDGAVYTYSDLSTNDDHKRACINDYNDIKKLLKETFGDSNPYVIIGASNNAGLRPDNASPRKRETTDAIDKKCDGFFGNTSSREYYLDTDRYDSDEKAYKKPVFGGSDAHSMEQLKEWLGKQFSKTNSKGESELLKDITWVKADTTFKGLRQVFNEPKSRIYLGENPPKLTKVSENRTDYINSIKIYNKTGDNKRWFNCNIPLNPGLVAIIGKKGSGKSALTDVIALGGRTSVSPSKFSFLTRDKFMREEHAEDFALDIKWLSGEQQTFDLRDVVDSQSELERVKYLPQKFVEDICNEFGVSRGFQSEIDKVIFSYVPRENKLGTTNLEDLINLKSETINRQVVELTTRLIGINKQISKLEAISQPDYLHQLSEKINKKKEEIKSLTKPDPVPKPAPSDQKDTDAVNRLNDQIAQVEQQINQLSSELVKINTKIQQYSNIKQRIDLYKNDFLQLIRDLKADTEATGIRIEDYLTVTFDEAKFDEVKRPLIERKAHIDLLLGNVPYPEPQTPEEEKTLSLLAQKVSLEKERDIKKAQMSAPEKKYQDFLVSEKHYQKLVRAIQGSETEPNEDTINYLQAEANYISSKLENDLTNLYTDRNIVSEQIYKNKVSKKEFFEEIYQPLVELLDKEKDSQEQADSVLEFTVQPVFAREEFVKKFESMINFGKKGFFMGRDEGLSAIKEIIAKHDTKSFEGIRAMLSEITDSLKVINGVKKNVSSQLLVSAEDFYKYLYELSYVEVQYNLQFNGKDLSQNQFSPGEKGALLLIFYLLIEQSNVPLIIDQPEENLDNESVFKLLVPYIRKVSEHRQVIIVTHNPNLAVVCDADQIIHAAMDKKSNKITYTYGSLEMPNMNVKVSDVLEGTLPAFDIRNSKYARI